MALKGVKVLEFIGLAPGPFCGMVLANLGASVTIIEKMTPGLVSILSNGKRSIALDTKTPEGIAIIKKLSRDSDVLVEPYRPGIMEKMGLGPDVLLKENPKLIYARLTGYGQKGPMSAEAGHDINYLAISGVLSLLGRKNENPLPPINLLADFAGGGLMCALGIVAALFERTKSGKGQIIDASMVGGVAYLSTWLFKFIKTSMWSGERGTNLLDGGMAFYDTYKTKDHKYMSVGAIEPHFYDKFISVMNLKEDLPQFTDPVAAKSIISKRFSEETREFWTKSFCGTDACVAPVLSPEEAPKHPQNTAMNVYSGDLPNPAPILSRTPSESTMGKPDIHHGQHTVEILQELRYTNEQIRELIKDGVVYGRTKSQL